MLSLCETSRRPRRAGIRKTAREDPTSTATIANVLQEGVLKNEEEERVYTLVPAVGSNTLMGVSDFAAC